MPDLSIGRFNPKRRRSISGQLDRRRAEEADITYLTYVRPFDSRGLHVVKTICNDQEIVVGANFRGLTFKPGTTVPIGQHTGFPGRFILGGPPPLKKYMT